MTGPDGTTITEPLSIGTVDTVKETIDIASLEDATKPHFEYWHNRARALAALLDGDNDRAIERLEAATEHLDVTDFDTAEPALGLYRGLATADEAAIVAEREYGEAADVLAINMADPFLAMDAKFRIAICDLSGFGTERRLRCLSRLSAVRKTTKQ